MAKLILSLDGSVLNEFPLTKERTTIGRKPHNDIQIDNLAVSSEHAVVIMIANDCFLEDVGSTNGTLLNGEPVKRHILRNNDVIGLGKYKLVFVGRGPAPALAATDYDKTMVWRPAASKPVPAQAGAAAAKQPSAPDNTAAPPTQAGAAAAKQPSAPGSTAARVSRTDARAGAAAARAAAEPDDARKPIWKVVLFFLVILIVGLLLYRIRG